MATTKHDPLRKIANDTLANLFHDLTPALKDELTNALVRQWLTYDGYAGIISPQQHFWFHIAKNDDGGWQMTRNMNPGTACHLLQSWHVNDDQIPEILHSLNLLQSTVFLNNKGQRLQLSMVAKERTLWIDQAQDEEW